MDYTLKSFTVNGKKVQFNTYIFDSVFKEYCKKNHIRIGEMTNRISERLSVSGEAVRNWRKGINGPSDLEKIADLENILEMDVGRLLKDSDGGSKMEKLTERQIVAVKKIYDALVVFLHEFRVTDGFNITLERYQFQGHKNPVSATYDYIEEREKEIYLVLEQEFFDLRGTEIYTELNDFAYDDLVDTYNEKISPGYRVAALIDDEGVKTDVDYYEAMEKLNSIIEKYC